MKKDKLFTWQTLLLVLSGIAVNFCFAKVVLFFEWHLFIDSVGTIVVAALGGILPGMIVGFVTNCINSIADPITLYYGILNILIAVAASFFSLRGAFIKPKRLAAPILTFAFIGGVLGSFMTWMLYGLGIGEGISAGFASFLLENTRLNLFFSQFTADVAIDLADKIVTVIIVFVILKLMPGKVLEAMPHGELYAKSGKKPSAEAESKPHEIKSRRISLGDKITAILIAAAAILSIIGVYISYTLYEDSANIRYTDAGVTATALMSDIIDADRIDGFLLDDTAGRKATEQQLYDLKKRLPLIKYMYVYRIEAEGCRVVFDLDTEELKGSPPGTLIGFDEGFSDYLPALLAGDEIEPVISNGKYGWLLTVYMPLVGTDGKTKAYAATDISMETVRADRYVYIIRTGSLLFGVSVIIVAFAIWFVRYRMVAPLNALTYATDKLAYDSEDERQRNIEQLKELDIKTGDEIENLYSAISKTTSDVSEYLSLIDLQSREAAQRAEFIAKLQDNIIISFANMVEKRDETTGSHIKRTAGYVRAIGASMKRMGIYDDILTDDYLMNLEKSAPLHDIGKIKVPDTILCKPGRLTPEEFEVIKTHSRAGMEIISEVLKGIEGNNYLSQAMDMAYCHHERWDGKGYPRGLHDEEIPLCARIMAVADVFDALISKRSYKEAFSFDDALKIIREGAGTQFDAKVVEAFLFIGDEIRKLSVE